MGQPYVGEVRMFAGTFAPAGWMFCDGSLLPISEFETLFNLIGTTFGGDGQSTFALPDLRGRIPVHQGTGPSGLTYIIGQLSGQENVTLTINQIPSHNHVPLANGEGASSPDPANNVIGTPGGKAWFAAASAVQLGSPALQSEGGNQPHDNFMPYLCVNFIISMFGIFPSQT
jgi:microcystin-dependent protein